MQTNAFVYKQLQYIYSVNDPRHITLLDVVHTGHLSVISHECRLSHSSERDIKLSVITVLSGDDLQRVLVCHTAEQSLWTLGADGKTQK